ncbi:unnamed protein product [Schistosoma margrebowiei]|uniref:Uncharacterized protein n=1 Tax=Schistosoma margrebowiei TaxID=48269 RepID=A0A183LKV9_9TREM|nr:unnamed protein product [Schistosoma margrebowiei]
MITDADLPLLEVCLRLLDVSLTSHFSESLGTLIFIDSCFICSLSRFFHFNIRVLAVFPSSPGSFFNLRTARPTPDSDNSLRVSFTSLSVLSTRSF